MLSELKLIHNLKTDPEQLYLSVLDFKKFGDAHPFMTTVDLVDETSEYSEFLVREKVRIFGIIPHRPKYYARVFEIEKNRHIRYTSNVMRLIDLSINFIFENDQKNKCVRLHETIYVKGNRLLSGILLGLMKESHEQLFKIIESKYPYKQ